MQVNQNLETKEADRIDQPLSFMIITELVVNQNRNRT